MLKPHLSYIAAISVHRRTSGYPWRGGSVRSDFQCRLLYLKTYGGSREVVEDGRSLLNSWRWSLGWYKWGVKCTDPNSRTSVFWTTLLYVHHDKTHLSTKTSKRIFKAVKLQKVQLGCFSYTGPELHLLGSNSSRKYSAGWECSFNYNLIHSERQDKRGKW